MTPLAPSALVGGDFRVVRPLSAGGMGAVYVAEQISTGKQRALKIMHGQLRDDPKQRKRFVREARIAASIESRHVVEVISAGVEQDSGMPWIVMELLQGCDLAELIEREGPLPIERVRGILEHICHALGAAHDAGIVHRDMKPQNVFLAEEPSHDSDWVVKVLDFGIAKVMAQATMSPTVAMGSPAWMAPEQGETNPPISPATDVWALGLLVFWMLTGRMYWLAANNEQSGLQALMKELLFSPLVTGTARAEALGVSELWPSRLDPWLACCLVHEAEERFVDARELMAAFVVAEADEEVVGEEEALDQRAVQAVTAAPLTGPTGVLPQDGDEGSERSRGGVEPARDMSRQDLGEEDTLLADDLGDLVAERAERLKVKVKADLHSATGGPIELAATQPMPRPSRWRTAALALALLGLGGAAIYSQVSPSPPTSPPASPEDLAQGPQQGPRSGTRAASRGNPGRGSTGPAATAEGLFASSTAGSASAIASGSASASALAAGSAGVTPDVSAQVAAAEGSAAASASSTARGRAASTAKPTPRFSAFDRDTAQFRVTEAARAARLPCGKIAGKRQTFGATLTFMPAGDVQIRLSHPEDRGRAACVIGYLRSAAMGPFTGKAVVISVQVPLHVRPQLPGAQP